MKLQTRLPSLLLSLAVASISFSSCSTTFDPGPLRDTAVSIAVSKVVSNSSAEKREERIELLHEAADSLEALAGGIVNRATVDAVLDRALASDPEVKAILRGVILGYFPAAPAPLASEKFAALARSFAAAIRVGLPTRAGK